MKILLKIELRESSNYAPTFLLATNALLHSRETSANYLSRTANNVKRTGPKFLIQQSVMSCAKRTSLSIPVIQIHAKNVVWITVREKTGRKQKKICKKGYIKLTYDQRQWSYALPFLHACHVCRYTYTRKFFIFALTVSSRIPNI